MGKKLVWAWLGGHGDADLITPLAHAEDGLVLPQRGIGDEGPTDALFIITAPVGGWCRGADDRLVFMNQARVFPGVKLEC